MRGKPKSSEHVHGEVISLKQDYNRVLTGDPFQLFLEVIN